MASASRLRPLATSARPRSPTASTAQRCGACLGRACLRRSLGDPLYRCRQIERTASSSTAPWHAACRTSEQPVRMPALSLFIAVQCRRHSVHGVQRQPHGGQRRLQPAVQANVSGAGCKWLPGICFEATIPVHSTFASHLCRFGIGCLACTPNFCTRADPGELDSHPNASPGNAAAAALTTQVPLLTASPPRPSPLHRSLPQRSALSAAPTNNVRQLPP